MKTEKMSFVEWLEEVQGITWEDWDEHYCGLQMEEIEREYDEYFNEEES